MMQNQRDQGLLDKKNEYNDKNEFDILAQDYIIKWVDYSNKYGLGYIFTNGCVGVYFNDFSKIILDS